MDATREMADGCLLLLWMNGVVRVEENAQACRARWRGKGICWARIKGILIFLGPKGSETTEGRLTTTRHWQQEDSMLDCWMRREGGEDQQVLQEEGRMRCCSMVVRSERPRGGGGTGFQSERLPRELWERERKTAEKVIN